MSPIFPCKGCGTFIERSAQHYRRMSGQVLCSTCADARRESEAAPAVGSIPCSACWPHCGSG